MAVEEVRIVGSGKSWALFLGEKLVGRSDGFDHALTKARKIEDRLHRSTRPCMCCQRLFEAVGRFNRLCSHCKETFA